MTSGGGDEHYYQTIFFITFLLLNGAVEADAQTSDRRIDAVVATAERVFVFEFILEQPAPVALEQIEDKQYYLKYRLSGKPITLVGVSFDQVKVGWWCGVARKCREQYLVCFLAMWLPRYFPATPCGGLLV